MALIIVLLTLALVQLWGSGKPVHHDGWFARWRQNIAGRKAMQQNAGLRLAATVYPAVLLAAVLMVLAEVAMGWLGTLALGVILLLYCLGRGNFNEMLSDYLRAWYRGDLEQARAAAAPLIRDLHEEPGGPQQLHEQVFRGSAYLAFERLFAVLFWFLLLGIPGALLFRLSALYADETRGTADEATASRWLWLLEWLPVRVMGFSFAIVGNFAGCYQAWRQCLTCRERDTAEVLEAYLEGALGGIDASQCSVGGEVAEAQRFCGAQLEGLQSLLSRSLLLWVTVLALAVLFGY
ncbi:MULTISPECIES: regulatory signaling modulator protein AmpE [Microbulbifer]|uniref:regulatory signaling modulator protein AmpE n=1 Tax=Microbulbifer TaxID=48073 RepID=UPI001E5494B1|nr:MULTISPECIES: regulatory signaling modulator protein AmpE [Microbulbifer]UHQ56273.1 regulatory signaling modulator protein AmpE [Microbulbifer sp. YPW16]